MPNTQASKLYPNFLETDWVNFLLYGTNLMSWQEESRVFSEETDLDLW